MKYLIDCKLVKGNRIRPLLCRKACVGMNIVSYLDNDAMNKPDTGEAHVYAASSSKQPVTKDELIRLYPKVFSDGVGCLEREYRICVDQQQSSVNHSSRKVPVALRDRLKALFDDLGKQDIVAPVTEPILLG